MGWWGPVASVVVRRRRTSRGSPLPQILVDITGMWWRRTVASIFRWRRGPWRRSTFVDLDVSNVGRRRLVATVLGWRRRAWWRWSWWRSCQSFSERKVGQVCARQRSSKRQAAAENKEEG
jgi:hypothetical protein